MRLAPRLSSIKPSPTLALNAKARALAAKGVDVVSFAAGEPDFDTPEFIKQAGIDAINAGFTKYTATAGIPELRQAVVDKLKRENSLEYVPEEILVSVGAKHSLYNIFQALLGEGDEVIIFSPYWVSYPDMVHLAGGTPLVLQTREADNFEPNPDELRKALTPKTRAIILNSPSNPTGAVISDQTLKKLAEVVKDHDCLLVTDDIYEHLNYTGRPFHNVANVAPELKDRTVVVNGFSKGFSMTGWRLGWAAGPRALISAMQMIQDQSTSNPASMVQKAGVAALRADLSAVEKMVVQFRARRDHFHAELNTIEGLHCRMPDGAFYLFPNVQTLLQRSYKGNQVGTSVRLSEILLEDFQLAAVPGAAFGAEGFLRFSFATSLQMIDKGLERLRRLVAELK